MFRASQPDTTLWHITISPYSEKVRWALDHKKVPYRLRAPVPGAHAAVALWLTRGKCFTFPVIQMNGENIGDSTQIIAAIERRHRDRPLYPSTTTGRQKALELEDWLDEEIGPNVRRFVFHELIRDSERFAKVAGNAAPTPLKLVGRPGRVCVRGMMGVRYQALDNRGADQARARVLAGFDRLEAELGGKQHLVGDSFSIADLTAAALFYPIVCPPEADVHLTDMPEGVERLRNELKNREGYRWVEEMFRRYRREP